MFIEHMQTKDDLTGFLSKVFKESNIDTYSKLMIATDEVLKIGQTCNGRDIKRRMDNITEAKLAEKMGNEFYIERVIEESIPKLADLLEENCGSYVLNEGNFFSDIMRMIFGPSEFSVSSSIVSSNVFADNMDIAVGKQNNHLLNCLIDAFNPAINGANIKHIDETLPMSEFLEEFDDTTSKIIKYYDVDVSRMEHHQFIKLRAVYQLYEEDFKDTAKKAWGGFTSALSSIGDFIKTQYEKLKYFWKDTYTLTTEINDEFKRLGPIKLYGRDGLKTTISIPVDIVDAIIKTSTTIKDRAASIANQPGASMDFSALLKTADADIDRLKNHVENNLINEADQHGETFSPELFIAYTKAMKHIINGMGEMYKHIISVEKDLTTVKFSGDNTKEGGYEDLGHAISVLKSLLGKLESNFNQIVSKYIAILKMALKIMKKEKDNPNVDKNDVATAGKNVGGINDGEDNVPDDGMGDMGNMNGSMESLCNNAFLYYYHEFTEGDTSMNVHQFEAMVNSKFNVEKMTSQKYTELEAVVKEDNNHTFLNEDLGIYDALSKPIFEDMTAIRTSIIPNLDGYGLMDNFRGLVTVESMNDDMEYIKKLRLEKSNDFSEFHRLKTKYEILAIIDESSMVIEGFQDDYEVAKSVSELISSDGSREDDTVSKLMQLKRLLKESEQRQDKVIINQTHVKLGELVSEIEDFFKSLKVNAESKTLKYTVSEFIMKNSYRSDDVEYVYTTTELIEYVTFLTNILLTTDCIKILETLKNHSSNEYNALVNAIDTVISELYRMSTNYTAI